MTTKLTITLEKSVIEKAKLYAKHSGRSLSDLIEAYLQKITSQEETGTDEIPEEFQDLFGSVTLPAQLDDKAAIREIYQEKFQG